MDATTDVVTAWLLRWFEGNGRPVPGPTVPEKLALNYFDAALIDSFGVIELIQAAEAEFAIQFTERHFQDRRFATVGGLSALIAELAGPRIEGGHT